MSIRILYVDDEPDLREIAMLALSLDAEFEVRCCSSGAEALATVGTFDPHLMLLDVMMPQMDGPTTLARLREQPGGESLPVVFITARTQAHEVDAFMASGATGVISKPFDPMTLAGTVRRYLVNTA